MEPDSTAGTGRGEPRLLRLENNIRLLGWGGRARRRLGLSRPGTRVAGAVPVRRGIQVNPPALVASLQSLSPIHWQY